MVAAGRGEKRGQAGLLVGSKRDAEAREIPAEIAGGAGEMFFQAPPDGGVLVIKQLYQKWKLVGGLHERGGEGWDGVQYRD